MELPLPKLFPSPGKPFLLAYILACPFRLSSTGLCPLGSFFDYPGLGRNLAVFCTGPPPRSLGSLICISCVLLPSQPGVGTLWRASPSWSPSLTQCERNCSPLLGKLSLSLSFPSSFQLHKASAQAKHLAWLSGLKPQNALNIVGNKENTVCSVRRVTFPYYQKIMKKKKSNWERCRQGRGFWKPLRVC